MMGEPADEATREDSYSEAKSSKFRFKSNRKHGSRRHKSESDGEATEERRKERHRSSRRRHKEERRSHRRDRHPTSTVDGEYYDPDHRYRESLYDDLDPETSGLPKSTSEDAFRESLFDALADDEGAAYWEGVYGQPIHVYNDKKPGPDGKLERMSEEEYADYVRSKMWEKTHQHIVEEREAKERARKKRKAEQQRTDEDIEQEEKERETLRRRMEESLRRGDQRKKAKEIQKAWDAYLAKWNDLKNAQSPAHGKDLALHQIIPWPVLSGRVKDVCTTEIERFLRGSETWKEDPAAILKVERVRWHPDKMQQRFGQHIDTETMRSVTAVFQVIDRLWNDHR